MKSALTRCYKLVAIPRETLTPRRGKILYKQPLSVPFCPHPAGASASVSAIAREDSVTELCRCACCEGPLEPAQQLRFLVETDNLDNPAYLARIRALPAVNGRPVPVCKACQSLLEANAITPQPRPLAKPKARRHVPNLLGVLGALSVGLILGSLLTPRS